MRRAGCAAAVPCWGRRRAPGGGGRSTPSGPPSPGGTVSRALLAAELPAGLWGAASRCLRAGAHTALLSPPSQRCWLPAPICTRPTRRPAGGGGGGTAGREAAGTWTAAVSRMLRHEPPGPVRTMQLPPQHTAAVGRSTLTSSPPGLGLQRRCGAQSLRRDSQHLAGPAGRAGDAHNVCTTHPGVCVASRPGTQPRVMDVCWVALAVPRHDRRQRTRSEVSATLAP